MNNRIPLSESQEYRQAGDYHLASYYKNFTLINLIEALVQYEAAVDACRDEDKEPSHYLLSSIRLINRELLHINIKPDQTAYRNAVHTFFAQQTNNQIARAQGNPITVTGDVSKKRDFDTLIEVEPDTDSMDIENNDNVPSDKSGFVLKF